MARRIYSEDLVLNLIVNGSKTQPANKKLLGELYELDRQAQKLTMDLAKVEMQIRKLKKGSAGYDAELKKLTNQKTLLTKKLNEVNAAMQAQRQQIGRMGLTINQLNSYLRVLKIQLSNSVDPTVMRRLRTEIAATEDRIRHLTTGASRMSIAFERMGTVANKFGTVMSWIAITTFLVARAIGGTISSLRELDKTFSGVMKTTGLTREEMWRLKGIFDELNKTDGLKTPTSTMELLEIARIAGRLGVRGVEDVAAFTLAVDKLYVSLGEDLKGTVEEVAEKVGKLVNVFRLTEEMPLNEALLRAGSLINELGKRSAASAETVLNYTARLGGVGSMAKFTIDQLAGLGAALDAMNVPAERGSTAVVKLITGLGQHAEKFARILGWSVDEYRRMVEEDVNGVLMAMLEASQAGNESIMGVVESMGDMEVSGVRVAEVFGKLTQNLEFVREQQEIARVAFESSASVMNEYYIVARDFNSLMAIQGKRMKALSDDYSKAVAPALYKVYRGFIDVVYALRDLGSWVLKNNHLVKALAAAWVAFKAQKIYVFIYEAILGLRIWGSTLLLNIKATIANAMATAAMGKAYTAAGGGIKGVTAALRVLWATMLANPFTAIIAVAGALASAFFLLRGRADEVSKAIAGMGSEVEKETTQMNALFNQVKKYNSSSAERIKGIQLLNERYGDYLPKLLSEKSSIDEITKAQNRANIAMKEGIALRWRNSEFEKIEQKYRDEREKVMAGFYSQVEKTGGAGMQGLAKFETEELLEKVVVLRAEGFKGTAWRMVEQFRARWKEEGIDADDLNKMLHRTISLYDTQHESLKKLNQSTDVYLSKLRETGKTFKESEGWQTTMPEGTYEQRKADIELTMELERNALQQRMLNEKLGEEWLSKELLKIEEVKLRNLLALEQEKWTKWREVDKDGIKQREEVLIGGTKQINDAMIALNENLIKQGKEPKAKAGTKAEAEAWKREIKDLYTEIEIEYQKAYLSGLINKDTFDRMMFELELEYSRHLLAELRARGESTVDLEKEIFDKRIKQQEKNLKDAASLEKAMRDILNPKRKSGEPGDPDFDQETQDLADRLLAQKKRIRQFLGLDKDEELESKFAAFHTDNFAEQFRLLDEALARNAIKHEEHELLKTEITKAQTKARAKLAKEALGAVNNIIGEYSNLQRAKMERELDELGDNEAAKDRIRKEYAEKQRRISIAQALISGAMSIMSILEGSITKNPLIDSIIKGVLIAASVATTGMQVATIKAQQFAKGSYPVMGADDGRVYDAQWVGSPKTGIYKKPSLGLFAERPEMVIDWPTLQRIQFNNPGLIDAILAYRRGSDPSASLRDRKGEGARERGSAPLTNRDGVKQYAGGSWPIAERRMETGDRDVQERLIKVLDKLEKKKLVVYTELIKKDLDTLDGIERNRGM